MTTNPRRKHPADHHAASATDQTLAEPGPTGRGTLRTYAVAVALTCLLTVLVTVVVAGRAPTAYTSTGEVLIESTSTNAGVGEPMMGNEKQVAESGRVAEIAAERLGLHGSARDGLSQGLAVTVPVDTTVLRIGYTSTDPGVAYARAVAFSDAYMDYRNSQKIPQVARLVSVPNENDEGSGRGLGLLVAVGLLAGAALGVCLAWAWDRLRDRFRTLADLERHSGARCWGGCLAWATTWTSRGRGEDPPRVLARGRPLADRPRQPPPRRHGPGRVAPARPLARPPSPSSWPPRWRAWGARWS